MSSSPILQVIWAFGSYVFVLQYFHMKNNICVIGGATWDALFTTSKAALLPNRSMQQKFLAFPYGGKVDADDVIYGFGGGAANASVGLARLGLNTAIITRVGKDWRGQEVVKNLQANKVITKNVQVDSKETTALSFIVTTGGAHDHVAFVSRGSTSNLQLPTQISKEFNWFYITSLATKDWNVKLLQLFKNCKKSNQQIFWNPGARQFTNNKALKKLLPYVAILDLNKEEAELVARDLKLKYVGVVGLLKALHKIGPEGVLITDGANGAYFYDGQKVHYQKSYRITPINTTGAGDGFGCGFLAGYLQSNKNVAEGLQWGMLNSSSVIMHSGPQKGLLTVSQLKKFIYK